MAVTLIKKAEVIEVIAPWRKVTLGVALVLAAMAGGAGVLLVSDLARLQELADARYREIEHVNARALEIAEEAKTSKKRLAALGSLLARHTYPSGLLQFLEEATLPEVSWTKLGMSFREPYTLELTGKAKGYRSVAQQVERLKRHESVASVSLHKVSLDTTGDSQFSLIVSLRERVWQK